MMMEKIEIYAAVAALLDKSTFTDETKQRVSQILFREASGGIIYTNSQIYATVVKEVSYGRTCKIHLNSKVMRLTLQLDPWKTYSTVRLMHKDSQKTYLVENPGRVHGDDLKRDISFYGEEGLKLDKYGEVYELTKDMFEEADLRNDDVFLGYHLPSYMERRENVDIQELFVLRPYIGRCQRR